MINLLGDNDKKQLHAARRNTIWLRYTSIIIASLITINLILGATAWSIIGQKQAFEQRVSSNASKRDKQYLEDKANAEAFRKNLTTAKVILNSETAYSKIILDIAHTIPSGCVMGTLTLSTSSFDGALQPLSFKCRQQSDAVRLKTAMEENTGLFGNVSIVSTVKAPAGSASESYPVSITMSTTIKRPVNSASGDLQ